MLDRSPEPLLEEYKKLADYANTNALTTLRVPPLVLGGIAAFVASVHEISKLFGIASLLAVSVMLLWLGYCHSMVNGIGLRLVELEQKMNRKLGVTRSEGFSFYSEYIAEGTGVLPGFAGHSSLSMALIVTVLLASLTQVLIDGPGNMKARALLAISGLSFNLIVFANMVRAEWQTRARKAEIMLQYQSEPEARSG